MRLGSVIRKTCHRWNILWDAHELTFSCFRQQAFLSKNRTCHYLTHAIRIAKEKHAFDLWGYVFMPEHVHLLIWPRNEQYSISDILQSIKQSVSRRAVAYLRKHNPAGLKWLATGQKKRPYHFWQEGGGYDRNVKNRESAKKMIEYIHNNPVRRGLVTLPEDWLWSSYRDWEDFGTGPLPIDKESFLMT